MIIDQNTRLNKVLNEYPECKEFLYPYLNKIDKNTTINELAQKTGTTRQSHILGLKRYINRVKDNPCDYENMRAQLIKSNKLNVAGYVNFLFERSLIEELERFAIQNSIELNLNIIHKPQKKEFQNYLSLCETENDLPDILIGKGFSSLNSTCFYEKFVKTGLFTFPLSDIKVSSVFKNAGFCESNNTYHPFAIEEMVMLFDKTVETSISVPISWKQLLEPEFEGAISQMGKAGNDHFGFVMMLYLFSEYGKEGIENYVRNVKNKQHFAFTIKNLGRNHSEMPPISILHNFASTFLRSDAQNSVVKVTDSEGNPSVSNFLLIKSKSHRQAEQLARHFFSPQIKKIVESNGASHISSEVTITGQHKVKWIGWDYLSKLCLPYLKEELSEIAYAVYNN